MPRVAQTAINEARSWRGKFFQVDRNVFRHVAKLGLNPAVSYLVMACGTGADNRTSSWSVNAIEKYTGIGRGLARRSIDALIASGAITQTQGGKKPRYVLEEIEGIRRPQHADPSSSPDDTATSWIWLPNSLVTGVGTEVTPLERVRGLQDVRSLQLLITMYDHQNLADNGGLHWLHIRRIYSRKLITNRGIWNVWAFSEGRRQTWPDRPIASNFVTGAFDDAGCDPGREDFSQSFESLERLGLVECVPHLVEADTDEAAVIFACPDERHAGTDEEKKLGQAVRRAAFHMLESSLPHHIGDDEIIPVLDRFPKVAMVGIYRLRYRPHTALTAAWIANTKKHGEWLELYRSLF